jgi:hypothetical protein
VRLAPSSPRFRRRLARIGAAAAAAGIVAAIALLVPDPKAPNPAPAKNAPPAQFVTHSTRVTTAERRAIDRTLDEFIPAALDRSSPATAWRLAGPELKSGSSLRQWRQGTSPIPYYPARGTTFHDWTTLDAGPGYVVFDLLVHPRHGSQTSSWVFSGEVIKHGPHWLVNRLYTIAVMQRPTKSGQHEIGPADFAAGAARSTPEQATGAALGKKWLLVVVGLIDLVLLFPLGFGIASVVRSRRRRRQYQREREHELPPLPRAAEAAQRH